MPNNVRSVACLHCHVNETDEGLKLNRCVIRKPGFFGVFYFSPTFFKNIFEKHAAAAQARKSTSEIM